MKRDALSGFHPAAGLCFFAAVLGITMLIWHPVYLAVSFLAGLGYFLRLHGWRGLLRQLVYLVPVMAVMALMNPLFSHEGTTVLFTLPWGKAVTWESVCFGLASAGMMGASIVWFGCFSAVFTTEKIICLFGRTVPGLSLLLSMTLRFIPRFQEVLRSILLSQRAMEQPTGAVQNMRQALAAFSATVSWAMEQSIVCADSMKSRGYGAAERTAFTVYRWELRDGILMALMVVLGVGAAGPWLFGRMAWSWFPQISGELWGPGTMLAYICCGGLCALPLIIDWMEDRKWNALRSGI